MRTLPQWMVWWGWERWEGWEGWAAGWAAGWARWAAGWAGWAAGWAGAVAGYALAPCAPPACVTPRCREGACALTSKEAHASAAPLAGSAMRCEPSRPLWERARCGRLVGMPLAVMRSRAAVCARMVQPWLPMKEYVDCGGVTGANEVLDSSVSRLRGGGCPRPRHRGPAAGANLRTLDCSQFGRKRCCGQGKHFPDARVLWSHTKPWIHNR